MEKTIYHITSDEQWQQARSLGKYQAVSLQTEGFIHCSTDQQVIKIANTFYQGESNLIVLCISTEKLQAPLKWEAPIHPRSDVVPSISSGEKFPHVYGAINIDAVVSIISLILSEEGYSFGIEKTN